MTARGLKSEDSGSLGGLVTTSSKSGGRSIRKFSFMASLML